MVRPSDTPENLAIELTLQGLGARKVGPADAGLFDLAAAAITQLPELALVIGAVLSDVHILDAEPGYDVSHSEPRWRSTIFVSVPDIADEVGVLRLAESIVHESMHLLLTNEEERTPLVRPDACALASPWRDEERPCQGVLHGLFVFVCVAHFFRSIASRYEVHSAARTHLNKRVAEIAEQVLAIDDAALRRGLTEAGNVLVTHWLVL